MALTKVSYSMIDGATVNVLDFGAVGDNVADDTAAIQAAVDSISNGVVYFPVGTYKITGTISINGGTKPSINFLGDGLGSEIIYSGITASIPMFYYYGPTTGSFVRVENLNFRNAFRTGDTAQNGIIAWRFGKKDAAATSGDGGIGNVTFYKNQILYCDYGLEIYAESDQFTIEENIFFVWNKYAVWCGTNPVSASGTGSASVRIHKNIMQGGQTGSWAIKHRGATVSIVSNVIQNATNGSGIELDSACTAFNISNNYTESTGTNNFIFLNGASSGSIENNQIGGYPSANIIDVREADNINIGQNFYATSGGFPNALIIIDSLSTGINIIGNQYQTVSGGLGIVGDVNFQIDGSGNAKALTSFKAPLVTTESSSINIAGASNYTLFTAVANACYLVNVSQAADDYAVTAVVTTTGDASPAIVTVLYSTNANLSITATGLVIKVNNGTGNTKTVFWGFIRIA
jgi:hypothetical protein